MLALLITEGGADFGLPDKTGRLPIDVARDLDRHQCVGMLLEAERGYALWKARRLKEAALLSVGGGGKWAWWGEGRRALPRVEVLAAVEEEEEGGGEGDEEEEEGQEEENEEEEERRAAWARCVAVANLVVEELPLDVFQELSGYL